MFNIFRRRRETLPPILYFKDGRAAFSYACNYMRIPSLPSTAVDLAGRPGYDAILGLVDGEAPFRYPWEPTSYAVRLLVEGGPVLVPRCDSILVELAFNVARVEVSPPQAGDLVLVKIGHYDPALPPDSDVQHFMIHLRVKPEMETATGSFRTEMEDIARGIIPSP